MSNQFDRENYPTQEPSELVVGDYWVWKKDNLASTLTPETVSCALTVNVVAITINSVIIFDFIIICF